MVLAFFLKSSRAYKTSPVLLDNIDFAENVNLKRLILTNPTHPATRTLLSRVVSPYIRVVWFTFRLYCLESIAVEEAELLERTLTSSRDTSRPSSSSRFIYETRH